MKTFEQWWEEECDNHLENEEGLARAAWAGALSSIDTQLVANAERWKALCELAGYWQDGSSQIVKLFDDDALREYFIKVGEKAYSGRSFESALAKAVAGPQEKS